MASEPAATRRAAIRLVSRVAAGLPVSWMQAMAGVTLVIPYYHMVSDEFVPHVRHLYRYRAVSEFREDVRFLLRHYQPVSLADIVDSLDGKGRLPRKCFHITFDDGFREMHGVVAPILERFGIPATFFVNTAFLNGDDIAMHNAVSLLIDRLETHSPPVSVATIAKLEAALNLARVPASPPNGAPLRSRLLGIKYAQRSHVANLAEILGVDIAAYVGNSRPYLGSSAIGDLQRRGFTIGAHSHDHPFYADLPLSEQLAQTRSSLRVLERLIAPRPRAFAFPHNDDGVAASFFESLFGSGELDVSFGTGGFEVHPNSRNLQRVRMEGTDASAGEILAWEYTRALYRRLRSRRVLA